MDASDYLNQQLAENPTGSSANDYLDAQLNQANSSNGPGAMGFISNLGNAPGSGLMNAFEDTALGGTQSVASGLHAAGILPDTLNIGGTDYGYNAGNEGIKQLKSMKDEAVNQVYEGDPISRGAFIGGDIAGNAAQFTAMPGLSSERKLISYPANALAGALLSGSQPANDESQRGLNAVIGAATSIAGKSLGDALSSQVTDPIKQVALKTAEGFDIPVYRNQVSDSKIPKAVASFEKDIPGSGATSAVNDQISAFNRAVNRTIGQNGDAVTPETLKAADEQIGKVYDIMTGKYDLPVDSNFKIKLLQLKDTAKTLGDQAKEYALQTQVDNVMSHIKNGQIDGGTYQGIRSRIGGLLRGQNGSPELGQLQDLLDSQFQGNMSPEDASAFQTARGQYRNMLAIEKVVANSPNEPISPAKLQGAVKNVFGDYAYGGGNNDLPHLARLGNILKDSFPDSGTATRNQLYEGMKHILAPAIGAGVGAGEGYHEGGDLNSALLGAGGGLLANRLLISPYLYSSMSTNPSAIQGVAAPAAHALADYLMKGNH